MKAQMQIDIAIDELFGTDKSKHEEKIEKYIEEYEALCLKDLPAALEMIKTADHIIDMGPEGGDGGGTVIAQGTPEEVAENPDSFTGQYLKKILKQ